MALTIVGVQQARQNLSDVYQDTYLLIPGTSDYVTGGYVVTSITLSGAKLIQTVWVSGTNATASPASGGWYGVPVLAIAQVGTGGPGATGYTQFLFKVYVASTGVELASGGNLTGAIWQVTIQGN
jgi:hypothetical protein